MSINYAILGLLSRKPSTGYELKKVFEESASLYWSGNNNQIYKALLQLQENGLVTGEIEHQEGAPSKKIYSITPEGMEELREWVGSEPEAPEFKKPFLVQLAWADLLNDEALNALLSKYEQEIKMQLAYHQEKVRRDSDALDKGSRKALLGGMINENILSSYRTELEWIQKARKQLFENEWNEEKKKMNYRIVENENFKYIEVISIDSPMHSEQDALDLVALCGEHDTNLLILHGKVLSEDFFKLKTGVAGRILQKFVNYQLKVATVMEEEALLTGKFKDMALEANRGNQFRIFARKEEAEKWIQSN